MNLDSLSSWTHHPDVSTIQEDHARLAMDGFVTFVFSKETSNVKNDLPGIEQVVAEDSAFKLDPAEEEEEAEEAEEADEAEEEEEEEEDESYE